MHFTKFEKSINARCLLQQVATNSLKPSLYVVVNNKKKVTIKVCSHLKIVGFTELRYILKTVAKFAVMMTMFFFSFLNGFQDRYSIKNMQNCYTINRNIRNETILKAQSPSNDHKRITQLSCISKLALVTNYMGKDSYYRSHKLGISLAVISLQHHMAHLDIS